MMQLDADNALRALENSLRDCVDLVLSKRFGVDWINAGLRLSPDRIARWQERKETEGKRLEAGPLDSRLLYYADLYDLQQIISKHWEDGFKDVFRDKRTVEVYLSDMERLRDPHAHQRELSEHQKHMVLGVSAELRSQIVRYRSEGEDPEHYFPLFEFVTDNFGNSISHPGRQGIVFAKQKFQVGDEVTITVSATDPFGEPLHYSFAPTGTFAWTPNNSGKIKFDRVGVQCDYSVSIASDREYHALGHLDAVVVFRYVVLPSRRGTQ